MNISQVLVTSIPKTDVPHTSVTDIPLLRHTKATNYSSYQLTTHTNSPYRSLWHFYWWLMTDDWWLMIMKQNQLSQWSQSQIHLANHCENRLRISVGRPYVKNRNKTTFFLRRQIPGDQEDNLGVQNSCTWRSRPATWRNPQTNCEPNCWYLYGLCKRRRAEQSVNIHTLGCCVTCVSRLRHRTPRAVHTSTEHFC